MNEEELDDSLKKAISDRLFGWELIEFLDIDIEEVIEIFEEEILDNLTEIKEVINYGVTDTEDDD